MEILTLFACFEPLLTTTSLGQLSIITQAIFSMTGRVTMKGISWWTEKGGSYRTIQRFFATDVPWLNLLVKFVQTHLFDASHEYILAGDATTITKSGSTTHGIGRFFSGVLGQVVKSLEFFVFSLVDVTKRTAYPLCVKQTVRSEAEKAAKKRHKKVRKSKKKELPKKLQGRPKGVLNKNKKELNLSAELLRINELLSRLVKVLRVFVKVKYLALDGHFGHNQAVLMALENDLHLISKLRRDTLLFEKYEGKQKPKGARKKYGAQLNYQAMPIKYLKKTEVEGQIIVNYYQGIFLHKSFGMALNVVVIVKTDLKKQKVGYVILLSSDEELGWEKLIEYYSLRFQIEFNFRDAKQHFGLEDFMNTTARGVENAVNVSFLMVNVGAELLKNSEEKLVGINDLKTHYRGAKYARWIIKKVLKNAEPILNKEILAEIGRLGSIHQAKSAVSSA
jgi:putative transposase